MQATPGGRPRQSGGRGAGSDSWFTSYVEGLEGRRHGWALLPAELRLLKLGAGCGVESDFAVLAFPGFQHAIVQQRAQLTPDGSAFAYTARRRRTLTPPFALL